MSPQETCRFSRCSIKSFENVSWLSCLRDWFLSLIELHELLSWFRIYCVLRILRLWPLFLLLGRAELSRRRVTLRGQAWESGQQYSLSRGKVVQGKEWCQHLLQFCYYCLWGLCWKVNQGTLWQKGWHYYHEFLPVGHASIWEKGHAELREKFG